MVSRREVEFNTYPSTFRVVRMHLHLELSARHRHIGDAVVHKFGRLLCVHVDRHAVSGPSRLVGYPITVIEMRMLPNSHASAVHRGNVIRTAAGPWDRLSLRAGWGYMQLRAQPQRQGPRPRQIWPDLWAVPGTTVRS